MQNPRTSQPLWTDALFSFEKSVSVDPSAPHSIQKDQNLGIKTVEDSRLANLTFLPSSNVRHPRYCRLSCLAAIFSWGILSNIQPLSNGSVEGERRYLLSDRRFFRSEF